MSLPAEINELPPAVLYGKVVARVLHASVDSAADSGDKPQAAPATGTVTVTPATSLVSAPFALVTQRPQVLPLDADGFISDQGGHPFVRLPVGQWTFTFDLDPVDGVTLTIDPITVEVTAAHTDAAPLDLALSANYVPPVGSVVQVLLVPANPLPGQSLVADPDGGLVWADRVDPAGAAFYSLPPAGIPEDDLDLAVQGKLNAPVDQTARDAIASGLASRANVVHGHVAADVTDLGFFVDGRGEPIIVSAIADLQNALDGAAGRRVHLRAGTYQVATTITVPSNTTLTFDAGAVLQAANGLNTHVLQSTASASRITLRGVRVNGNAANQADDVNASGIYMADVGNLVLDGCQVADAKGHGIFLSNGSVRRHQRITRCTVERSGSTLSSAYGSGFATTNATDLTITDSVSRDNVRAGFRMDVKGTVTLNNPVGSGNGDGGIVPVSGSTGTFIVNGGQLDDNGNKGIGDGVRILGTPDVTLNGLTIRGSAGAGVGIYNGGARVSILGGRIHNNGKSADAVTSISGRSGVVIKHDSTVPKDITISNVDFEDTQATKTQDYGVEIEGSPTGVKITGNRFGPHEFGAIRDVSTAGGVVVGPSNTGLTCQARDFEDVTITGTLTETDVRTITIKAGELGRMRGVRIRISGTTTGTAGTKQVRFNVNGSGTLLLNQAAASPGAFTTDVEFWRRTGGAQRWIARTGNTAAASTTVGTSSVAIDTTDLVLKFAVTMGATADTLTSNMWVVEPIL